MSPLEPTAALAAATLASSAGLLVTGLHVRRLRRQLRTDALTGLANRSGLQRAVTRTPARPGECAAALMIDLDGFKTVNDTCGHRTGDRALVEIARRLDRHQQRGQLAVRLSGDEFALYLGRLPNTPQCWIQAHHTAQQVADSLAAPLYLDGRRLSITASVGGGIAASSRLDDLLEPADRAMYRQKTPSRRRPEVA
ncbi:diguanylate cyclase (GGDEF)-like protein [Halopolyspora algeriensis]|uniref:Diguanylate cyclase (GGDEF)-like protein n=1 Tax=Halopolyspora algeriensis TaxID=1500506 RepID=A0A368VJ30_9ACTN|nr:GGDEF domain-containing protein [Halopolyspora algeriensis]RCW40735.1 diguanylate cyclase (GGDEF)-like protein [Halopolyspora algeriensis]TQM53346.1 diguanylate cyclase (GGDEF)-like protein [Halopolyspora algeriensis]